MDRKGKGKLVAGTGSSSRVKKRQGGIEFRDEGLRISTDGAPTKKRKTPGVLQFFEESAEVGYYGGSSDEDCDIDDDFLNDIDDEPEVEASGKDDKGVKGNSSFVDPKEEEINEEEYDRMMEERYKPGTGFIRYADDDVKSSIEMDALVPTAQDPPIWKVKCAIGRERHLVFCLMHKFVELRKIGNKLQILSVFSVEHVKGFIFIEAEKEHDLLEACKSLTGIYATRMVLLPKAEAPNLLTVQRKTKNVSEGTWARVKGGIYKGDLAQVVAVSDSRRKALIKLIPRIDVNALTQKYGGGASVQKGLTPAPRLISSSELEEFRPLIQVRRDRDTGITFEHLDSLMLKDGFLYKKVSLDSLSSWGIIPSKEEILKFAPVERKETGDTEWISEIYGEEKKKKIRPTGKGVGKGEGSGGGKGEDSPESNSESSYKLYNLVCFSRKDFGLIVGVDDKGDAYKVLKEGSDGPVVVTVGKKEMQNEPFDSKFTALDLNNKQISVNDVVKISKGPSEGKQGVIRQVYRGIIFLYAESEEENGGYFCCKSHSCEKVKLSTDESNEKTVGFDASAFGAFGDFASSPKSPLSPEKEWQPKEKYINSNQGDKGSMYSIGQKLRIRVGPLKGYLCRVIALRYSDVTVKLDSQHKILTVKSEHLAEVRDRNTMTSGNVGTGSFPPVTLGTEGSSGDWAKGAGTSEEGGNWNVGGASSDLSAWGSKPTSDILSQQPTVANDNTSSWANAATENKAASAGDQSGSWNSWDKTPATEANTIGGWGSAGASKVEASSWGKQGASTSNVDDSGSWSKHGGTDGNKQDVDSRWGKLVEKKEESSWGKKVVSETSLGKGDGESSWGNKDGNSSASNTEWGSWGQQGKGSDGSKGGSAWGNQGGGFGSGEKKDGSSGWNRSAEDSNVNSKGVPGWGKPDGGSSWTKEDKGGSSRVEPDGGSSWSQQDGGSSWGKKDDARPSWGKKEDGGSSWGKKEDGGYSEQTFDRGGREFGGRRGGGNEEPAPWSKPGGGSSWGKQDAAGGGSSWGGKQDGGGGGCKPWEEQSGGRGFGGGRRGGGFRGGRDGGRSFDRDQSPGWKRDNQESTWKGDQSGGSDWKKGWGEDSNTRKPSTDSSSAGNWSSWGTNSNDKPGNDNKAAWGTGNDQGDTGNSSDGGWNKKPPGDVKSSGEADNAWGAKTNSEAPSSSGSAWGTGDKTSGW
uniref:Putative transcription elongation factor SPT5-like protein 1 n=1 Tax=Noccaea caerulescens TaxID=107243 RepID=A0A1J3I9E5_NOCCA